MHTESNEHAAYESIEPGQLIASLERLAVRADNRKVMLEQRRGFEKQVMSVGHGEVSALATLLASIDGVEDIDVNDDETDTVTITMHGVRLDGPRSDAWIVPAVRTFLVEAAVRLTVQLGVYVDATDEDSARDAVVEALYDYEWSIEHGYLEASTVGMRLADIAPSVRKVDPDDNVPPFVDPYRPL